MKEGTGVLLMLSPCIDNNLFYMSEVAAEAHDGSEDHLLDICPVYNG